MNLYLLITALVIFGGFLKVAQIVLSGKPEHSEADSANSPDVKSPFPAIQLGVPDDGESPLFPVAPMGVIEGFYSHDD